MNTRYPLEPLAQRLGIRLGQPGNPNSDHHTGLAALAERLNVSHSWAQKLHRDGLTARTADRYACRLGWHPSWIWGRSWWTAPDAPAEPDDWYSDDPPIDHLDDPDDPDQHPAAA